MSQNLMVKLVRAVQPARPIDIDHLRALELLVLRVADNLAKYGRCLEDCRSLAGRSECTCGLNSALNEMMTE